MFRIFKNLIVKKSYYIDSKCPLILYSYFPTELHFNFGKISFLFQHKQHRATHPVLPYQYGIPQTPFHTHMSRAASFFLAAAEIYSIVWMYCDSFRQYPFFKEYLFM